MCLLLTVAGALLDMLTLIVFSGRASEHLALSLPALIAPSATVVDGTAIIGAIHAGILLSTTAVVAAWTATGS
jgi:hypothetical protein